MKKFLFRSEAFCPPAGFSCLSNSTGPIVFEKSIPSPADTADKRRMVGKLGSDAIDTFSTKKENLQIVI